MSNKKKVEVSEEPTPKRFKALVGFTAQKSGRVLDVGSEFVSTDPEEFNEDELKCLVEVEEPATAADASTTEEDEK